MRWVSGVLALAMLGALTAQAAPPGDKPRTDKPAPLATTLAGENDDNQSPLSLTEAIRFAIDNSTLVHVVFAQWPLPVLYEKMSCVPDPLLNHQPRYSCGSARVRLVPMNGPVLISPINMDVPLWRFRADVMSLVRSVEQQYWAVAAQRVRVACAEWVVKAAMDVYLKEAAGLDCKSPKRYEIFEAAERLERFHKDRDTQAVRLTDAERRLHILLGLPGYRECHIVTTTQPIDQPVGCNWSQCRTDLVRMQADTLDKMVMKALCDATTDSHTGPSSGCIEPIPSATRAMVEQQETREAREWSDAIQRQIFAMKSSCSAVDAGYRQYQKAKQHRIDAARRLEAQKAYHDEGRITIDRYFDFISQNAEAVAAEADRASEYNTAIAALGEAKGTSLADRFILVIDEPLRMPKNWVAGPDKPEEPVKKAPVKVP